MPVEPAAFSRPSSQSVVLTGAWTAVGMGGIEHRLDALIATSGAETLVDGAGVDALDTAGAWVLQRLLLRTRGTGVAPTVSGLRAPFARLMDVVARQFADQAAHPAPARTPAQNALERIGRGTVATLEEGFSMLSFVGEIENLVD